MTATGRPPVWTDEARTVAETEICTAVASGRSLKSVLDEGRGRLPSRDTVYQWIGEGGNFADNYARARERQADVFADEITEIADGHEGTPDDKRIRIDARKWAAGKLKPKVYGDRLQLDSDVTVKLSDEQLESRLAQLLGKAGGVAAVGGAGAAEEEAEIP